MGVVFFMSIFSNHIFIKNAGIGRRNPNIARKSVLLLGLFLLLSVLPGIARQRRLFPSLALNFMSWTRPELSVRRLKTG
jgi:hypothetical protein